MSKKKEPKRLEDCSECGAWPGDYHSLGCDGETCPYCGAPLIHCLVAGWCDLAVKDTPWPPPLDDRIPWSGEWPGEAECRFFGWWVQPHGKNGWRRCKEGDRGAMPDYDRLYSECEWDRMEKAFIPRSFVSCGDGSK
jgi:hypothetical protein